MNLAGGFTGAVGGFFTGAGIGVACACVGSCVGSCSCSFSCAGISVGVGAGVGRDIGATGIGEYPVGGCVYSGIGVGVGAIVIWFIFTYIFEVVVLADVDLAWLLLLEMIRLVESLLNEIEELLSPLVSFSVIG